MKKIRLPSRMIGFILALISAAGISAVATSARETEGLKARLQAVLDAALAGGKFAGMTAGVVLADGTTIGLAAGLSDRDAKTPMKPGDHLLMGSVGKTYVAAVAMQLLAEGKIGLEDKISRWLEREPWFPRLPNGGEATIRHLMTHASGLVRYEFQERFTADLTRQPSKVWKPEELLSYVLDLKPPFAPGRGWEYSDTNYIVLGLILEKAGGAPYYDLLRRRILIPLKLDETVPADSRKIPGLVQGYAGPGNPFGGADAMIGPDGLFVINPQFEWTGGGLACAASDLARWAKLLYEGKAFRPDLVAAMVDAAVPARLGADTKYGLGVIIRPTPLGPGWGHSGFFPGYLTEMMYFPDHKIAAAVQFNTGVPRDIGRPALRILTDLAAAAISNQSGSKIGEKERRDASPERMMSQYRCPSMSPAVSILVVERLLMIRPILSLERLSFDERIAQVRPFHLNLTSEGTPIFHSLRRREAKSVLERSFGRHSRTQQKNQSLILHPSN